MRETERLVESLVSDLKPVPATSGLHLPILLWFLCSAAYVVVLTQLIGPVRPTALEQLQTVPRFALEMILGLAALGAFAVMAFGSAIPGWLSRRFAGISLILGVIWVGGYLAGIALPALEPSMLGKRDHCYLETFFYAVPPLLVALWWQRRHYALAPARAAMIAGLAAGGMPALYMQIACMYEPVHILAFHIGPGLLVAVCAPLLLSCWNGLAND